MNSNFPKNRVLFIIGSSVIALGFLAVLVQSLPFYNGHNFDLSGIESVKIDDRGLLGNDELEFKDTASLKRIVSFIKSSTKISQSDANLKANQGLCEIDIVCREGRKSITVVKSTESGGIITSGQFCFKSDSLLAFIMQALKNHQR